MNLLLDGFSMGSSFGMAAPLSCSVSPLSLLTAAFRLEKNSQQEILVLDLTDQQLMGHPLHQEMCPPNPSRNAPPCARTFVDELVTAFPVLTDQEQTRASGNYSVNRTPQDALLQAFPVPRDCFTSSGASSSLSVIEGERDSQSFTPHEVLGEVPSTSPSRASGPSSAVKPVDGLGYLMAEFGIHEQPLEEAAQSGDTEAEEMVPPSRLVSSLWELQVPLPIAALRSHSKADQDALAFLFPLFHGSHVYYDVPSFLSHCHSEVHLHHCVHESVFPLRRAAPDTADQPSSFQSLSPTSPPLSALATILFGYFKSRLLTSFSHQHSLPGRYPTTIEWLVSYTAARAGAVAVSAAVLSRPPSYLPRKYLREPPLHGASAANEEETLGSGCWTDWDTVHGWLAAALSPSTKDELERLLQLAGSAALHPFDAIVAHLSYEAVSFFRHLEFSFRRGEWRQEGSVEQGGDAEGAHEPLTPDPDDAAAYALFAALLVGAA